MKHRSQHKVAPRRVAARGRWHQPYAKKIVIAVGTLVIGLAGYGLVQASQAATYAANKEAESGTLGGAASATSNATASASNAVRFGGSTAITCDQAGIQKLVDQVSSTTIEANLRELVQDNTKAKPNELISRHVSSPGNKIKVDWANSVLTSYGLTNVNQNFVSEDGYSLNNMLGRITGTTTPNNIYAASGHIDSINSNDENVASKAAPGAEDNGSGIVVAMEAGRVLAKFKPCLKSTIDIIGFNDEEENFGGSYKYVSALSGKTFKGMYGNDMIGYAPNGECFINFYNNATRDKPLVDKFTAMNTKYGVGLSSSIQTYSADDVDSWVFWQAKLGSTYGRACVSDGKYPGYHSTVDNVKNISFSQLTKITKATVASLAELGMQ